MTATSVELRRFTGFRDGLIADIHSSMPAPLAADPRTLARVTALMQKEFMGAKSRSEEFIPFLGMQVIGARAELNPADRNAMEIRWETAFFPWPRYTAQTGECQALGYFGDFDLYLGQQEDLPPVLIARYGNTPGDYVTHNPALLGPVIAKLHGDHFSAAMERALFINADLWLR